MRQHPIVSRARVQQCAAAEVHCNLGEEDLAAALARNEEVVPTSEELVQTVRYVAAAGQISETEARRVGF